jgi:hypothetical protein
MFPATVPVPKSSHDPSTSRPALAFANGGKKPAAPVGMTERSGPRIKVKIPTLVPETPPGYKKRTQPARMGHTASVRR